MRPFTVFNSGGSGALVLTCEHASCAVPAEYDQLGLDEEQLRDHIAWDIGARQVTEALALEFDAPAVLAEVSRLVIDCNRALGDDDLIVSESHGVKIPGNLDIGAGERERRVHQFYMPYHQAIDDTLSRCPGGALLSVHSFTGMLNGRERRFDVGVLFDLFVAEAERLHAGLTAEGLRVRYNEPYSALDGLIFSARSHGTRHGRRYLELELNDRLLRSAAACAAMASKVGRGLTRLMED